MSGNGRLSTDETGVLRDWKTAVDPFIEATIIVSGENLMRWKHIVSWIVITLFLGGLGLVFSFADLQTVLVGFLIYLPLTGAIAWLMVYRGKVWMKVGFFGLWLLVFLGWLTYIGPYIEAVFKSVGDTF